MKASSIIVGFSAIGVMSLAAVRPDDAPARSVAALRDTQSPMPFMVIGEVVRDPYRQRGSGGVVWRAASPRDFREYVRAVAVSEEYQAVFDEILWENAAKDQELVEASMARLGPIDISAFKDSELARTAGEERAALLASLPRNSAHDISVATRSFLQARAKLEQDTLDQLNARCDALGVGNDPALRARAQHAFEQARWRAKCADLCVHVDPARIDVGLLALERAASMKSDDDVASLRRVISQYWDEITPACRQFVESWPESSVRIAALQESMAAAAAGNEQDAWRREIRQRRAALMACLFDRVDANMRWLPRIAEALPNELRFDFIWEARELMFQEIPVDQGVWPDTLACAAALPGLSAGQRSSIEGLRRDRAADIEELNRVMEELVIRRLRLLHTGDNPDLRQFDLDFQELFRQRGKVEEKAIVSVRAMLTTDQIARLPLVTPVPIPSAPFEMRVWSAALRQQRRLMVLDNAAAAHD